MLIPSARGRGGKEKGEDYDYVLLLFENSVIISTSILVQGYGLESQI